MPKQKVCGSAKSKEESVDCPVCDEKIIDGTHDSVECEGECSAWLHRKCAGLSKRAFLDAKNSPAPFLCHQCRLNSQDREIAMLKAKMLELAKVVEKLSSSVAEEPCRDKDGSHKSYATAVGSLGVDQPSNKSKEGLTSPSVGHVSDRKCNILVSGIDECESGLKWLERSLRDLGKVSSVIQVLDDNLSSNTVIDCKRLGKFDPDREYPRPILARLARPIDVQNVLSKRNRLSGGVRIKPDLPPEERACDTALMKERWRLIQSGLDKKVIKISHSKMYVNRKLHGEFDGTKFVKASSEATRSSPLSPYASDRAYSLPPSGSTADDPESCLPEPASVTASVNQSPATSK